MNSRQTGFDKFLGEKMKNKSFQEEYIKVEQEISKNTASGLFYYPKWIDEQTENFLLNKINDGEWESSLQRRVQQFGAKYNYKDRQLDDTPTKEIPNWLKDSLFPYLCEVFTSPPSQIIINEYERGQGITKHIDAPVFGPVIASLSLLSDTEMTVGRYNNESFNIPLQRRSLLVLSGDARLRWYHCIPKVKEKRISITFRTINKEIKI